MSKTIINSDNLNKAINELKYKSIYIDKLMSEMDNLSDEVAKINMDHDCFPITTRWIEAVQSKLNHYSAKIDELKYLCQSVVDIFSSTSEKAKASTNLIKEFNESPYYLTARQDLYRLLTGKEGELKLTYNNNELGSNVTGAYKTSFSNWNNTILNELKGRDWLTKEKIEEVTKALTTTKAASIINNNLTPNNTTEITGGETASSSSSTNVSNSKQLNTLNNSQLRELSSSKSSAITDLTPKVEENEASIVTTDEPKQDAALDTLLSNTNNNESSAGTATQSNSQVSKATPNTQKVATQDRMQQAKQAVESKSQPSTTNNSGEKVETSQPSKDAPKETIDKPSSGSSSTETDVTTPEPKHKTIPKDSSKTVTKVPKTETPKQSSTSSGTASKVIPVIAGVAAAGAAGVGTKIYLDSKSAPENKYINEEFVVDDSDYKASNYETAEIGTDADLLHEESSTYTTRANSETTDSKNDMLGDGISDDLTYGMNVPDNDMTFDESTPYEAIDNYEMGETH